MLEPYTDKPALSRGLEQGLRMRGSQFGGAGVLMFLGGLA